MSGKPGRMHSSLGPWMLLSFSPSYTSDYKLSLKCVQDLRLLSSCDLRGHGLKASKVGKG